MIRPPCRFARNYSLNHFAVREPDTPRSAMRRRKLWIALVVVLVAAAIAVVVYLRSRAAPEAARLLPESDAVLFINLRLIRLTHVFGEAPPISYDPDYERFVKETGFQFERDLDQSALAVHASAAPASTDQSFLDRARYSWIFIGRFDARRATDYFKKLAGQTENYHDAVIYDIPHEGRTVRVVILGLDTVAVSNLPDASAIHQMIDKYRAAAWPGSGPSLVREHFRQVPLGSVAWGLASLPAQAPQRPSLVLPGGLEIPVRWLAGATIVASARYLRALHLRVEALTRSENDARGLLDMANTFLLLLKSVDTSVTQGGTDADVKAFFDSLKIEQHGSRVALTATIPQGFIRKALTPQPVPPAPSQPPSPQAPATPPGKKHKSRR